METGITPKRDSGAAKVRNHRHQESPVLAAGRPRPDLRAAFLCVFPFLVITLLLSFCSPAGAQIDKKRSSSLDKRLSHVEKEVARLSGKSDIYTTDYLADSLTICDRTISFGRNDARERFEREFFQLLDNKGLLIILVKRYMKYFALINGEIQRAGMPSDLIYLVLTESYLNPRAFSKSNAAGLWQFIKETGKAEGLNVNEYVDERYDMKKATRSALAHLKRLHSEFGDWLIAMAAYNAGAGRLRQAIQNQETIDFFELYLPEETERYIFRIAAIKQIISDREKLGIRLGDKDLYRPVLISEITVELEQETHINLFAKFMDVPYRTFKYLNLHLRRYKLPKGIYTINVPYEKKEPFLRRLKNHPSIRFLSENS